MLQRFPAGLGILLACCGPAAAQSAAEATFITPLPADLASRTYDAACSSCHYRGEGKQPFSGRSPLTADSPDDLAQFILFGKAPEFDESGMPGFAAGLTDADVTRMVIWLRSTVQPTLPWTDVEPSVQRMRATGQRED